MDHTKTDTFEGAIKGSQVSRRWLLKNSANITAGTVAVSALGISATANAHPVATKITQEIPHCDLETGEIFDRERHHRWDTI